MFDAFILLLPAFVCATWALRLPFMIRRNHSEALWRLFLTTVSGGLTFFVDSCMLSPITDYRTMAILLIVLLASIFTLFPCLTGYTLHISGRRVHPAVAAVAYLPAFLMTAATAASCAHAGVGTIADYLGSSAATTKIPSSGDPVFIYAILTNNAHIFILGIWLAICWGVLLNILISGGLKPKQIVDFLKGKKSESQVNLNCLVIMLFIIACSARIIVGRRFLMDHALVRWILETAEATLAGIALVLGSKYGQQQVTIGSNTEDNVKDSMEELAGRLTAYMEEEEAFLDPHLSLESAAAALNTNRTYLSAVIRDIKGESFRSYVNGLRIEAAKREIRLHPEERLGSIAARTGFISDTQLVKKFTEMTGISPRRWCKEQK